MSFRKLMALGAMALCSAVANAQPTPDIDLGVLGNSTYTRTTTTFSAGQVKWVKFTTPFLLDRALNDYLDIDTNGGTLSGTFVGDTFIALYGPTGALLASDDDSGPGAYSRLSYGKASPTRPGLAPTGNATTTGSTHAGANGATLAAGTYWLGIAGYSSSRSVGATNWAYTSPHDATGTVNVIITHLKAALPTNPSCLASASPTSVRTDIGGNVTFTVTVTPGTNPTTTAHMVTADTSVVGDTGAQPKVFVEGPANTFTYVVAVPAGLPIGAANLTTTVLETAPQTGGNARSSTCVANFSIASPPTGQCCINGACSNMTGPACMAAGGTYNGDGTVCAASGCTCAVTPANDSCDTALTVAVGGMAGGSTCLANAETTLPTCNGYTVVAPSVWYKVSGNGNSLTAAVCGAHFDTKMSIYCGSCGNFTCITANDDFCATTLGNNYASSCTWCSQATADYYVVVHGFSSTDTGVFILTVTDSGTPCVPTVACLPLGSCCVAGVCSTTDGPTCANLGGVYGGNGSACTACSCLPGPANDSCDTAEAIAVGGSANGSTCQANAETSLPSCGSGGSVTAGSVWYKTTGTGNTMTAATCGAAYDSKVSVYCGSCGNFTCIGGNNDSCGTAASFSWCSQIGANYFIVVHGNGNATGAFTLTLADDGAACGSHVVCIPEGACCVNASQTCFITTADDCANRGGTYSGDNSTCTFTNIDALFASEDLFPIAINDNSTIQSVIDIPEGSGTINGLIVQLGLHHTFTGDLIGTLSNGSTTVTLFNRQGGTTAIAGDYQLLDAAASAFPGGTDPAPPGQYKPSGLLSAFDGQNYEGHWVLTISDNANLDTGSLDDFAFVSITTGPTCSYCPVCAADYNNDGGVDGGDVGAFYADWEQAAPCADVNADGGIDGGDVGFFFVLWEAGGC